MPTFTDSQKVAVVADLVQASRALFEAHFMMLKVKERFEAFGYLPQDYVTAAESSNYAGVTLAQLSAAFDVIDDLNTFLTANNDERLNKVAQLL